jgi:cytochrome P450
MRHKAKLIIFDIRADNLDNMLNDLQNEKEDILSRFLVESTRNPEKMDDQYLRDIILSFMIAGKDTSANTVSWFIYMLCKNPLIQEKIAQEARDGVDDGANVDEFMANITDATLDRMHYLHAALTETLRLYPAAPLVIIFYTNFAFNLVYVL